MGWNKLLTIATFLLVIFSDIITGQTPDKLCATSRYEDQCSQLQRGNSEVNCIRVQDSIECAQKLRNGTADFGIFTAESALQLAALDWADMAVVKELRHRDRIHSRTDYDSVVIVKVNHTEGLQGLRGLDFCHPGYQYDKTQRWTERFLKHFERAVAVPDCDSSDGLSAAEIETAALASFFRSACRPGTWSHNPQEDAELKAKYPQLCALCQDSTACKYIQATTGLTGMLTSHELALNCLINSGQVAYVALETARQFFLTTYLDRIDEYAFLCPNGTKQAIRDNVTPCTWLSQPWKLMISRNERAIDHRYKILNWMSSTSTNSWESALREIIGTDSYIPSEVEIQSPRDFFRLYREVPVALSLCSTQSTWCTTSLDEKDKCEVIRAGAMTSGVYPILECLEPQTSVVTCLNEINTKRADFMGIDSNFGYLARHPLNLTAALFGETANEKYSQVIVLIRANSTYERFENFKHAKACFPEFSGIASMAFINTGKNRGFFDQSECKYARLLGDFFGSSCMPGARDILHDRNQDNPDSLCTLCKTMITVGPPPTIIMPAPFIPLDTLREVDGAGAGAGASGDFFPNTLDENEATTTTTTPVDETFAMRTEARINCNADESNRFYGNRGALRCLHEHGDVAVVELQYLKDHAAALGINPQDFRIMCKNGTLADRNGFDVDDECPLITIVDNEVVVRRGSSKTNSIANALISLDRYFQIDPDFKMYNSFNGITDLLFKDSTIGLAATTEEDLAQSVKDYIKLFDNLEDCVNGSAVSTPSSSFRLVSLNYLMAFITILFTFGRLYTI